MILIFFHAHRACSGFGRRELQADTSWGTWAQKAAAVSPDLELPFLLGLLRRLAEAGAPVNAAPETPADAWDELFRLRREGEKGGKG